MGVFTLRKTDGGSYLRAGIDYLRYVIPPPWRSPLRVTVTDSGKAHIALTGTGRQTVTATDTGASITPVADNGHTGVMYL